MRIKYKLKGKLFTTEHVFRDAFSIARFIVQVLRDGATFAAAVPISAAEAHANFLENLV